jgi:hypothetical protein
MAFMPQHAPLVILAFLAAAAGTLLASALFVWGTLGHRTGVRRWSATGGTIVVGGYMALLLIVSLASRERVLAMGERKYFCEMDCHAAYSVAGVRRAASIGTGAATARARGTYLIVRVEVRFDETTISARRPRDLKLYPNPRRVEIVDARGRRFARDAAGQRALESETGMPGVEFTKPLLPGESYVTEVVFDVPSDIETPRLELTNGEGFPIPLIIGHERSPLHRKVLFALEAS